MDMKKTGALIREARKEQGLTQSELAEKLHISDRTVSKWERAAGFPDVVLLESLADTLGVPVQCLITGERMVQGEKEATAEENEHIVREAIRYVYEQGKRKLKSGFLQIVAGIIVLAMNAFIIFGLLDYSGAFLREVSSDVPALIYEDGTVVGETIVTIEGSIKVIGKRKFFGKFIIPEAKKTNRGQVDAMILWDEPVEGLQKLEYSEPGLVWIDTGVYALAYVSPDLKQFAVTLEDGRIIATNEALAELQNIYMWRYALSYEKDPYIGFIAN